MILDLMILTIYIILVAISEPGRKLTSLIVCVWFVLSFIVASLGMVAIITFPIYWVLALVACILLALRLSLLMLVCMSAMALLQLMMCVDAIITDKVTVLLSSYSFLSLAINLFLIAATYLHGRGLENADCDYFHFSIDNNNNSGN